MSIPSQRTRFTVAGVGAAVIGGLLLWAVLASWHPLRPRLVCVMPLGNGQTAAFFGYTNHLEEPLSRPIGEGNYFEPGPPDRRQPTAFPGKITVSSRDQGFAVAFAGERLTWVLDGREATATPDSPQCPMPKAAPQKDLAWVKPKPPEPPKVEPPKPPEPPKVEDKPPEPKPEKPPEPPPPAARPPRVKTDRPPPPQPKRIDNPPEPVPLALDGLTNLGSGVVLQAGTTTTLGSPEVEATPENTVERADDGTEPGPLRQTAPPTQPKKVVKTPPKVKVRPRGEWPADAPPRAGAVLVKLSLRVGVDGKVLDVKVVKGAGAAFDREAKAVGRQAVFDPATEDGKPVEQWVPWVVEFTPDGG